MRARDVAILLGLALLATRAATSAPAWAGPARPPNPSQPAAPGWLSFADIVALARSAGFTAEQADKAARIAWRESRGNPKATAIVTAPKPGNLPERSFGLWQVNALANPQFDEAQLLDPAYNAKAAFRLSKSGTDWRPWNVRTP